MKYYECHITILATEAGDKDILRRVVEQLKWTFSCIDGDPVEGPGVKCYATRHFHFEKNSEEEILSALHYAAVCISHAGFSVIREKIELVIYDTKSDKVRLFA